MSDDSLRRELTSVEPVSAHQIRIDGNTLWNFASNDYLGLSRHPAVIQAANQALIQYGMGSGSSALLSGFTAVHKQLSQDLANWKQDLAATAEAKSGTLKTVLFPTGFAANLGVCQALLEDGDLVLCDRRNHASIIDGLRLTQATQKRLQVRYYRHRDLTDLERLLEIKTQGRRWVITDSVFSMDGTIAAPQPLLELVEKYDATLIVDEAHATGVCGKAGAGLFPLGNVENQRVLAVGTLSKALGAAGGFVCCHPTWAERIVQSARSMIYSTSLPIPVAAAARQAVELAQTESHRRDQLNGHVHRLHEELGQQGWQVTGHPSAPLLSIVTGDAASSVRAAFLLKQYGVFAPAIRPPTVRPLECRIRISPMATMDEPAITALLSATRQLKKQLA